jgi:hypothetical protein
VDLGTETEDASLLATETTLFTARVDPCTRAAQGGTLELAVDPSRFHFFDPSDGRALVAEAGEIASEARATVAIAEEWS